MNFTKSNTTLNADIINDTGRFSTYINQKLQTTNSLYGIGGYNEHRTIYSQRNLFDRNKVSSEVVTNTDSEPRRLHLGIDIWGNAGTPVFAALGSIVHSYAFNNNDGDYGATIILQHQLDGIVFYTLYGHVSQRDFYPLKHGDYISAGTIIAHFGEYHENGHWPPHLHFQIIRDMHGMKGDYPGVCKFSEKKIYLDNCPDPDLILQMMKYAQDE